jgi:hypothetical protein
MFVFLCRAASGGTVYNVTLDTSSLVGHPAGPFFLEVAFTDGSGVNDANNTVSMRALNLGGGTSFGSPFLFGGAGGSLESGITLTDTAFLSLFSEVFLPGNQVSFTLDLTLNDDAGGVPDRFTMFLLDSSGVPLPTMAPFGDYFLGGDLSSTGPVFDAWAGDPTRTPSVGGPIPMPAPEIASANTVPEPAPMYLFIGAILCLTARRFLRYRSRHSGWPPDVRGRLP